MFKLKGGCFFKVVFYWRFHCKLQTQLQVALSACNDVLKFEQGMRCTLANNLGTLKCEVVGSVCDSRGCRDD